MIPKFPLTQPFEKLPQLLPVYPVDNALLPGGEFPITVAEPEEMTLFFDALKTDQLIGLVQRREDKTGQDIYDVGCAGRIRQYRELKDGQINIMLTGVCRFRVVELDKSSTAYRKAVVDWSGYQNDYMAVTIDEKRVQQFKDKLRLYFSSHKMQVDWNTLEALEIEELLHNLVLVTNFTTTEKQRLVEAPTVEDRLVLFTDLLDEKPVPIWGGDTQSQRVN
jgi:Lon protease-like protein